MNKFKVGDKVYVAKRVDRIDNGEFYWPRPMVDTVLDGILYTIRRVIGNYVELCNRYNYPYTSLSKKYKRPKKVGVPYLKKLFRKEISKTKPESLCSYAFLTNTNKPHLHVNDICFASLRRGNGINAFIIDLKRAKYDLEMKRSSYKLWEKYAKYILSESPWSKCFRTNHLGIARRYVLEMDTNKPLGQIAGAAVALREGSEHPECNALFDLFCKKKLSKNVAYILSKCFVVERGKEEIFSIKEWGGGHHAASSRIGAKHLFSFFANGFPNKGHKPANQDNSPFEIFNSIGSKQKVKTFYDFIIENLKGTKIGQGWQSNTIYTLSDVLEFGKLIEIKINELKVQNEN